MNEESDMRLGFVLETIPKTHRITVYVKGVDIDDFIEKKNRSSFFQ